MQGDVSGFRVLGFRWASIYIFWSSMFVAMGLGVFFQF